MNTKVVPNPEQKGWEEDGTTPNGTPIYKWESGGGSGGSSLWEQNGNNIYYNDGNVGVGTSDISGLAGKPTIHVNDGSGNGAIRIGNVNSAGGNVFLDHSDADGARIRANSTDLNIGSSSAHNLNLFTGDTRTTRLTIDAAGKVGVGTDDPKNTLHVQGRLQVDDGGVSKLVALADDTEGFGFYEVAARPLRFGTANTERLRIDESGKVGIGMTPTRSTFDLSAKEQLAEWKTKAKKASWPIVTDGAFEQEPTEDLVAEWMETRAAGDRLQVAGGGSFVNTVRVGNAGAVGVGLYDSGAVYAWQSTANASNDLWRGYAGGNATGDITSKIASNGDATFSGTVTATRKDNSGAPTSTKDPAILLMGGDSSAGDGGEIGFGAFTNRKFAAIKGFISDGNGNGAGHLDFYTRENPNTAEMSRALRIASNRDAEFTGSVKAPTFDGTVVRSSHVIQDGSPVIDAKGLISTLSTLRKATKDETTLEGMRDALADAIGGLIENLEHEIATMPAPEPEVSTMETEA